jgi:hypothetical protein
MLIEVNDAESAINCRSGQLLKISNVRGASAVEGIAAAPSGDGA